MKKQKKPLWNILLIVFLLAAIILGGLYLSRDRFILDGPDMVYTDSP